MRNIKSLLKLMVQHHQQHFNSGLCALANSLQSKSIITKYEYLLLIEYISVNRPKGVSRNSYYWAEYSWQPRLRWLNKHINDVNYAGSNIDISNTTHMMYAFKYMHSWVHTFYPRSVVLERHHRALNSNELVHLLDRLKDLDLINSIPYKLLKSNYGNFKYIGYQNWHNGLWLRAEYDKLETKLAKLIKAS